MKLANVFGKRVIESPPAILQQDGSPKQTTLINVHIVGSMHRMPYFV